MTPEEFLAARATLGLTQRQMAEALGMGTHGWQSISGWENGKKPVPDTVCVTVDLLLQREAQRRREAAA